MALRPPGLIEVRLTSATQLFNSMDPSPFHERDLDHDAEAFIVGWAREVPSHQALNLRVTLKECQDPAVPELIRGSLAYYFTHRAQQRRLDLKHLLAEGRTALFIGLAFLAATLMAGRLLPADAAWTALLREGLTICGWVGMWRPIEIHLYRWWPIRQEAQLQERLARAEVEVIVETQGV